jgi:hypothetical protein
MADAFVDIVHGSKPEILIYQGLIHNLAHGWGNPCPPNEKAGVLPAPGR